MNELVGWLIWGQHDFSAGQHINLDLQESGPENNGQSYVYIYIHIQRRLGKAMVKAGGRSLKGLLINVIS